MAAAAAAALTLGLREGDYGDQEEEECGPSKLRRHLENLEDALAARIELWRSRQARCIDASDLRALERVRDDLLLIEIAVQEEGGD